MPAAAQPSKSAGVARRKTAALSALEPPTTRPRCTGTRRSAVSSASRCQAAGSPGTAAAMRAGSRSSAGKSARGVVLPRLEQQHARPGVGEAAGQRAAGRAGPHDDDVLLGQVEHQPPSSPSASGRSSRRTLPVDVRGSSSSRCRPLGRLAGDSRSRAQAPSSVGIRRPDVGRDHPLAPLLVGQPEHGALDHVGMGVEDRLHLGGVDVDAAGDDQVLAAAVEPDRAVVVHPAEVADGDQVAAPGGGRLLRRPPVLEACPRAAPRTTAGRARRSPAAGPGGRGRRCRGEASQSSGEQTVNWASVEP